MELRLGSRVFGAGDFAIWLSGGAERPPEHTDVPERADIPEGADVPEPVNVPEWADVPGPGDVPEGVDIVTATGGGPVAASLVVAQFAPVPGDAGGRAALLVGDELAETAAATGAGLVCRDPQRALTAGVRADGIVVDAGPRPPAQRVAELTKDGLAVMVSLDDEPVGEDTGLLAAVSIYAWLGVRVFRVAAPDVAPVRQVLDMVASIAGTRPPALTRRGLA
ncbi:dihydropteroate synthase [Thermomonospora echinospora]|uniref:Dihydropteroate synthase n=1 Tax=Thermomonospora echinospora TaxID=1992 RepID=A0A1H6A0G4_9ACTN|nr:hypothetical protein [Thermomonospora echinospora]SEG42243.1 dihydropteroate synthase [Thermomonospora echinospora]